MIRMIVKQLNLSTGTLINIIRYPIKGFSGEHLATAELSQGKGLPGDRRWAIRNGSVTDKQKKDWEPCSAFVRMTQHEELPTFYVNHDKGQYYLAHPSGGRLKLEESKNHQQQLTKWFKHDDMVLSHSHDKTGYWDHKDAHLSIINLSTVKAMSAAAGVELDPQRFRGNLLIDTEKPWSEFSLIGKRLVVGSSEIEILRPIDRCKATSVNPETGISDINIPHFLSSQYGHFFCGVYARVVKSGRIQCNDALYFHSQASHAIHDAIQVDTAPAPKYWPRAMRVIKKVSENHNVISFYLEDPLGSVIKDIAPASYLRLHGQNKHGSVSRSYTISKYCKKESYLRLSIKKEIDNAQFSPWIHRHLNEGDSILASGPFTDPSLQWQPGSNTGKQVVIFTAGIGITVASSILLALQRVGAKTIIRVAHSVQYKEDAALWNEVTDTVSKLINAKAWLFVTREKTVDKPEYMRSGRIAIDEVMKGIDPDGAQIFLCGPCGFADTIRQSLISIGINDDAIHEETFHSPVPIDPTRKIPTATDSILVKLDYGDNKVVDMLWQPSNGTLLELTESNGINLPANCRSGACRACLRPIQGEVENILEPVTPAPKNWAYLCCASPVSAITISLDDITTDRPESYSPKTQQTVGGEFWTPS